MSKPEPLSTPLSRREREVMEIIHRQEAATAAAVQSAMVDPPTNAAVRATLRSLVEKGHLRRHYDGPRYVYAATASTEQVRHSAVRHLLDTFFGGSAPSAMAALLEVESDGLSADERARLKRLIDDAAKDGR